MSRVLSGQVVVPGVNVPAQLADWILTVMSEETSIAELACSAMGHTPSPRPWLWLMESLPQICGKRLARKDGRQPGRTARRTNRRSGHDPLQFALQ
jgi:hypothetical protein